MVPYNTQLCWPFSEAIGPFAGSVEGRPSQFVHDPAHRVGLYKLSMELTGAPDSLADLLEKRRK